MHVSTPPLLLAAFVRRCFFLFALAEPFATTCSRLELEIGNDRNEKKSDDFVVDSFFFCPPDSLWIPLGFFYFTLSCPEIKTALCVQPNAVSSCEYELIRFVCDGKRTCIYIYILYWYERRGDGWEGTAADVVCVVFNYERAWPPVTCGPGNRIRLG